MAAVNFAISSPDPLVNMMALKDRVFNFMLLLCKLADWISHTSSTRVRYSRGCPTSGLGAMNLTALFAWSG